MINHQFINVTSDGDIADELGSIKAQIKELRDQQSFLEELLKHKHVEVAEGALYRVSISYGIESHRVNWKKVAEHFSPSRQLITAHSKVSVSDRVNVSSHKK